MRNSALATLGILATACITTVRAIDYDQCVGDSKTAWALLPGNFPVAKLNATGKPEDNTAVAANECENEKDRSCAIRRLTHNDAVTTTFMAGVNAPLYFADLAVPWVGKTLPLDFDVDGANPLVNITDQDICIQACQTRGPSICNAVTYRRATFDCWLKKLDDVPHTWIGVRTGIPITVSQPSQQPDKGGRSNKLKIGIGVGLGALGGALAALGIWYCCVRGTSQKEHLGDDFTPSGAFNRTSTAFSGSPSSEASYKTSQPPPSASAWSNNATDLARPSAAAAETATPAPVLETYAQYMEHLHPVHPRPGSMLPPGQPLSNSVPPLAHHQSAENATHGYHHNTNFTPQSLSPKAFEAAAESAGASTQPTLPPPQYMTLPYGAATSGSSTSAAGSIASDLATAGVGTAGAPTESVATPSPTLSTAPSLPIPSGGGEKASSAAGGVPWVDAHGNRLERDEFFMDRVHLVKRMYSPKASDEILVRVGDSVVLQKLWGDGWATGINTTTGHQGVLPLAALGLQPDGSQAPPSVQAKTGELPEAETQRPSLDRR
ncbi:hypothetical protein HDU86_005527 [Geranomyces michiganensis]|nr:hypothetical protein HDU86_005527 [Geranomyces michiganensis]